MRTCTTSSVQPARGSGASRELLAIKVILLIEHGSKALTLHEHMWSSHHSHPLPVVPIIVTLGPLDPDNDMCTQLADKITNNITIMIPDLKSWHSGPSDCRGS